MSEGEQCRKKDRVCEGQELVNMDELNHRGTRFPVDEDTNNFLYQGGERIEGSFQWS